MRKAMVLGLAALLAACGDGPQKEDVVVTSPPAATGSQTEDGRPVLAAAGIDVVPIVSLDGTPWSGPPVMDELNHDGSLNLTRRTVAWRDGMIDIDRAAEGGLHYVRIQSGIADRCGPPAPLGKALAGIIASLHLPIPSPGQTAEIVAALQAKDGSAEVQLPNMEVKAFGGCLPKVTVKAT